MKVKDFYPLGGSYRPGQRWEFAAEIGAAQPGKALVSVQAHRQGWNEVLGRQNVHLRAGLNRITLAVPPPGREKRGYMVQLVLADGSKRSQRALTAIDVVGSWRDDPRYGFLSEFAPSDAGAEDRIRRLARFHLNCLQFYDWMYRHFRLLPPSDVFQDALGRRLSLATVRRGIDACHKSGMAALAYAAVYAAEAEFADAHRDWGLFDRAGKQHDLADLFYLMDLGRGSGWPDHMLGELRATLNELRFDGFHLDQYGYPAIAYTFNGKARDVARDLARFIKGAAAIVRKARPGDGVIFNCVDAWPLVETGRAPQAATYVEVWKPYRTYADLVAIVNRARELAPQRPVIIAAYPSCLRKKPAMSASQVGGTLEVLTTVLLASGAWPLLLGEGDRVLADAYYPKHVQLPASAERRLRDILDLGVAAREYLRDHGAQRPVERAFIDGPAAILSLDEPLSSVPAAGHIWVTAREGQNQLVISLVDLVDQTDDAWDRPHSSPRLRSVRLGLAMPKAGGECWVMSPGQLPAQITSEPLEGGVSIAVNLRGWALVVVPL